MPVLTFDALKESPFNVIKYDLPDDPPPWLLEAAHIAADYCRSIVYVIVQATNDGSYRPRRRILMPAAQHISEIELGHMANQRLKEIRVLYEKIYGEPMDDGD